MSFFSAIGAGFSSAFKELKGTAAAVDAPATDARNLLTKDVFANGRSIFIAAFVGLLIWNATSKLLDPAALAVISNLVWLYILVEGAIHLVTVAGNMVIKVMELKAFMSDGKLDDNETKVLTTTANDGSVTIAPPPVLAPVVAAVPAPPKI